MPLELQIIRANEFVRLGPREHLDFQASKEALALIAMACRKRGIDRALLDLRELPTPLEPLFSPAELAALVDTFREAGFAKRQKLAILYRSDPHHGARLFAFIGMLKGWRVRAFAEFEEALLWLSSTTATKTCAAPESDEQENVDIQRRKPTIAVNFTEDRASGKKTR